MLYLAIVLCAFVAAATQGDAVRRTLRANDPVLWLLILGFVYWGLSLGNGFDWIAYFRESECLRLGYCDEAYTSFEPLFTELLRLSAVTDYQIVPLAAGLAACTAIWTMARSPHFDNYSILFFVSIATFYLYIEQVRQGMAMCMLILALHHYMSGRDKLFALLFGAACLFHWTSLLFAVPFLLARAGRALVLFIAAVVLAVFSVALSAPEALFDALVSLGLGELDIAKKIFFYAVIEDYKTSAIGLGFLLDVALMLLLLAPIAHVRNARLNLAPVVAGYFAVLLLSRINISVYRVSLVFVPFVCLYLADFFRQQRSGVVVAGVRCSVLTYGLAVGLVMVAQSSRPLLDPILQRNMFNHRIYLIHGLPTPDERSQMSEDKCDFLEEEGKGFLCGRW